MRVERRRPDCEAGKRLKKMGLKAQDRWELFFDGAKVPIDNLPGPENRGLRHRR